MTYELRTTEEAKKQLRELRDNPRTLPLFRQATKAIGYLITDPKHSSLNTHKFHGLIGPDGQQVFEAYAQNRTASAYRIFFHYGPDRYEADRRVPVITVIAVVQHPN